MHNRLQGYRHESRSRVKVTGQGHGSRSRVKENVHCIHKDLYYTVNVCRRIFTFYPLADFIHLMPRSSKSRVDPGRSEFTEE